MRIGVLTVLFQNFSLEEALDKAVAAGVTAVEIGTGGYPGSHHCHVDELLASDGARRRSSTASNRAGCYSAH
jgi:sugar phosphate isomerase/epimerase